MDTILKACASWDNVINTVHSHQHNKADKNIPLLTFNSIFPIFADDLRIGRPTRDGKMNVGKLVPLNPHFTNYKTNSEQTT